MSFIRKFSVLICVLSAAADAQLQVQQAKLPYAGYNALTPRIDAKTMELHYGTHYAGYVKNLNAGVANATAGGLNLTATDLTSLIKSVSSLPAPLNTTVRNQGGGAWNHALYFKQLAPPNNPAIQTSAISQPLRKAITLSFRTVDNMTAELTSAAGKIFGSGWAWLCYTGDDNAPLAITTTPNQDNPLMGQLPDAPPVTAASCTPILGIDVWEHAYYLKHGPKRPAYLNDFWDVLSWQAVSSNYANAASGKVNALVA
ncbi:superoxide dismutase [Scenedesmus sp. NREL 46B-D3]|nr:superoxide dismutase [Scenedesmus sp. NREL 46B-D3]